MNFINDYEKHNSRLYLKAYTRSISTDKMIKVLKCNVRKVYLNFKSVIISYQQPGL